MLEKLLDELKEYGNPYAIICSAPFVRLICAEQREEGETAKPISLDEYMGISVHGIPMITDKIYSEDDFRIVDKNDWECYRRQNKRIAKYMEVIDEALSLEMETLKREMLDECYKRIRLYEMKCPLIGTVQIDIESITQRVNREYEEIKRSIS
jgi:hypothetical protein